MLSERQGIILHNLIKEYIDSAQPVGSVLLKKRLHLDVSPATIRNELQELTGLGYLVQPHTSAGRVPTEKGYKFFVEIMFTQNAPGDSEQTKTSQLMSREIESAKQKIEEELKLAQELTKSLENMSTTLSYTRLQDKDTVFEMLKIIGPSRRSHQENIDLMKELLEKFENF